MDGGATLLWPLQESLPTNWRFGRKHVWQGNAPDDLILSFGPAAAAAPGRLTGSSVGLSSADVRLVLVAGLVVQVASQVAQVSAQVAPVSGQVVPLHQLLAQWEIVVGTNG
ncbi:Hypothetical predicted protein [Cloeon dipterum]|uniref:Uncharacterized protein n=1 Tax=Cloeon dipterum TaxID=197152 RepID=A0A8S1E254_9INSE|nr:Hypothetical predicted protein [Cloeon dipterum]